jgi:hypothetical protein
MLNVHSCLVLFTVIPEWYLVSLLFCSFISFTLPRHWRSILRYHISPSLLDDISTSEATEAISAICSKGFRLQASQAIVTNFYPAGFYLVLGTEQRGPKMLWPVDSCTGELGSSCKLLSICMCFLVWLLCNPRFFHLIKLCPFACIGDVLGARLSVSHLDAFRWPQVKVLYILGNYIRYPDFVYHLYVYCGT